MSKRLGKLLNDPEFDKLNYVQWTLYGALIELDNISEFDAQYDVVEYLASFVVGPDALEPGRIRREAIEKATGLKLGGSQEAEKIEDVQDFLQQQFSLSGDLDEIKVTDGEGQQVNRQQDLPFTELPKEVRSRIEEMEKQSEQIKNITER